MNVKICNRCGKRCDKRIFSNNATLENAFEAVADVIKIFGYPQQEEIEISVYDNGSRIEYDLCADCSKEFYKFMNGEGNLEEAEK